jgi:two-component system, OmpR family, response regulator
MTTKPSELVIKQVFTTGEAAEICKISQQTIIRCFDNGRVNGFRVPGSRFRRIPRDELLRFMRDNNIPTDTLEGTRKRILVVDDDEQIVELFVDVFGRDSRYELRTAASGYDAGLMTEQFKPDLILLDYMLPDVNGNVVCQSIRNNPDHRNTRIIFVSGVVNQAEIQELLAAGADDFIKKPFDIQKLIARVGELLGV